MGFVVCGFVLFEVVVIDVGVVVGLSLILVVFVLSFMVGLFVKERV